MDMDLKAVSVAPKEEGDPTSVIFMLHGYGSHGREILNIVPSWTKRLPHTLFLAIEGPDVCEMTPDIPGLRQWFSMKAPTHTNLWEGANRVTPELNKFIDRVLEFQNIPASKAVLLGFCQGATMALHAAMARVTPLAGVLAYGGAVIPPLPGIDVSMPKTDVMLVHGQDDDVIPFAAMDQAKAVLTGLGATVQTVPCPECRHVIDDRGLGMGGDFLERKVG